MIVMQKIKEQNHKITSLLSLVTTMATEITVIKQNHQEGPVYHELGNNMGNNSSLPKNLEVYSISESDSEGSESDSDSETEPEEFDSETTFEPTELESTPLKLNVVPVLEDGRETLTDQDIIQDFVKEFFQNELREDSLEAEIKIVDPVKEEKIEFFEIQEFSKVEPTTTLKQNYSKLNISDLVDIAVEKNILSREKAKKLKKKELLQLLE